jgi:fibronectin-binding autotransporter adhesin
MKPRIHLPKSLLLASLAICFGATGAHAQQFWSGTGTWNTTNTNWGAVTGGPYTSAWANAVTSIATFEGTSGTVTVGANMNADGINFNVTGYELTATAARTLTGSGPTNYNLAANVTATIGSNITLQSSSTNQNWTIDGANRDTSILNLNGTIRNNTANTSQITDSTVNVNSGGQLIGGTSIVVGTTTTNSGSILNIAGTVSIGAAGSSLILNNTGSITANSTITLSNGGAINFTDATNANGIRFGGTGANTNALTQHTSTLNLDGGIATVSRVFVGGTYGTNGSSLAAVVNFNGGTLKALNATNAATFFEGFTQAVTNSSSSGAFVRAGGAHFDSNGFAITVGQSLQSGVAGPALDGGLTLNDTAVTKGTLTLSGANTYTGTTTVTSGTLAVASTGSIRSGNALTVASGGTANFANVGQTLGAVSNANTATDALNFSAATGTVTLGSLSGAGNTRFGSNGTVTGGISEGTVNAVGLLTANISGGTVGAGTLSSTTISGGATTVSGVATIGTLSSGTANLNGATSAITSLNGGTVNLGSSTVLSVSNGTHAGSITGSGGGLTKTSAGTLTLSNTGTYSYTGDTNVNAGTLVVNGNISTSNVTVADGATIGGSGTVGALTIQSGGFVNAGNSPGILNTGNYSQAGTLVAEITGLTAGTQHDQINVTGTVTLSGALSILATGGTYAVDNMIFLILNDGVDAVSGTFSGLAQGATAASFGGFDWIISYEANSTSSSFLGGNDVALRAIPEPSAALLGGLSILALLRRRRR